MKIRILGKVLVLLGVALFVSNNISAQKRMAVYAMKVDGSESNARISIVPEKIISFFSGDSEFVIIDRKNKELINDEMKLQKSESFIDGYIVEQGKAEGADLICTSFFASQSKKLTIKIYDVASNSIICTREKKMKSGWLTGLKEIDRTVTIMLHEISTECFEKGYPVVRITSEKKGKAKELLILAGFAQRIKIDYEMEIIKKVEEEVAGIKMIRKEKIGLGRIIRIEDDNFSKLKLSSGKKEIYAAIKSGLSLECRLIAKR